MDKVDQSTLAYLIQEIRGTGGTDTTVLLWENGSVYRLGILEKEWEALETVLLSNGLLNVSEDEIYLFQHEFREQYLQTLESNNAKRRN